jgi:hypothetical protein
MKGRKNASSGRSTVGGQETMAESTGIEQIVEKVVSQVVDSHIPRLREDLARRVLEEIQPHLGNAQPAAADGTSADLLKAVFAIHAGATQKEILRALLDHAVRYCGRAALFVIKSGTASGWQGRGFADNDEIKDFALDVNTGAAARAMQSRMPFTGGAGELDEKFVSSFGAPADDQALLLPLVLKDKIAALVYADAGVETGTKMDAVALELLVAATSAWLEVASLRKQAQKEGAAETVSPERSETAPPMQTVSSFPDPFASHAPKHAAPTPSAVEVEQPAAAEVSATVESEPVPVGAAAAAAPATAPDAFAHMAPEEADVHRKAQRFARLLVDEIKLYNQAKVTEGRRNKDVYDRLRDDIEKSRATYQKRYGNTAAASADYFTQEVVRSLAEDDTSIMGANFRR